MPNVAMNSVTALPDGGFAATNPFRRGGGGNPGNGLTTGANTGVDTDRVHAEFGMKRSIDVAVSGGTSVYSFALPE